MSKTYRSVDLLQNFSGIESDPFPHFVIKNALPDSVYAELSATFPEDLVLSTAPLDGGVTHRYKSINALVDQKLPPLWAEFFSFHNSVEFFQRILSVFDKSVPSELLDYASISQLHSSVRGLQQPTPFVTDVQYVVHRPLPVNQTTRTPHLDNPIELYAGLFYMKKDSDFSIGGDLVLWDAKEPDSVNKSRGREVDRVFIREPIKTVRYEANTFVCFLNVLNSVHSVTPRVNALQTRRSVNIIGEFNDHRRMWSTVEA
jgi:hypothetical protein